MEVKITMEKFMELVKRTAKIKLGRSATIEESTIAKNNELIYQGTEAMIHGNRIHRSAYLEQFYGIFKHDADLRECIGKMIRVDVKPETIQKATLFSEICLTGKKCVQGYAARSSIGRET